MPSIDELFASAIQLHRGGELAAARERYQQVLAQSPRHAGALNQLGFVARQTGDMAQSVEYLLQAIAIDDTQLAAFANLAEAYRALGQLGEAIDCYQRAMRLAPQVVELYSYLGTLLEQAGRPAEAMGRFREAIRLQPGHPLAHYNLGNAYQSVGQFGAAVECYRAALAAAPNDANVHLNLGVAQMEQDHLADARHSFEQVLRIRPDSAEAWLNLGGVAKAEGNDAAAISCCQRAVSINPKMVEAYNNWGSLLIAHDQTSAAIERLEQALAIDPNFLPARINLAGAWLVEGHTSEALAAFAQVLKAGPNDALTIKAALALPVIYESQQQIDDVRQRLSENLTRLEQTRLRANDPVLSVGVPAFYLAYLGHDECEIQSRIAHILRRATPALEFVAPHCADVNGSLDSGRRIKIGFVSNHLHTHTIGKLNAGIIQQLDRARFEVFVFRGPGHDDAMGQAIDHSAAVAVRLSPQLGFAQTQIAVHGLDVLVYSDIGMDALTYYLAHARLAPVQCVMWGHPLTTGIDTIDYFLSSHDLEPEGSDGHYSETLVRLPHLTNYYFRPEAPNTAKTRADFGFDARAHLYVCPQSLFKLHPQNDVVLRRILEQDPLAQIVLLEPTLAAWRELLCRRQRQSLGELADRIGWVPRQSLSDFRQLLAIADVLVDPLHFGGGDTSYEGFAVGTPIVTLPGPFLRSRITYAMYRTMGLDEGVAHDIEDYAARAVRLATDRTWNEHIRAKILAANHQLYENQAAVRELETFLIQAVEKG